MRWDIAVTTLGRDVGANVRLGIPQNIAGRTRLDEGFEDKAMGGIFCSPY